MRKVTFILWGEIKYDGRVQKEIRTLQKDGHEVQLIVSKFNNDSYDNYNFKIFNLDARRSRIPIKNFINTRILCKKAFRILKKENPDIVHCNDLSTLMTGYYYKKYNNKIKLIYDAHELFVEMSKRTIRKNYWHYIEKKVLPCADEIIMPEINRARYFSNKYKLERNITIIPNFPKKTKIKKSNQIEKKIIQTYGKTKILYIGDMHRDRYVEQIIKAFKYMNEDFVCILIGRIKKKFKKKLELVIKDNKLNIKVFLLDPVDNNQVIDYINSSDIGILFYKNSNLNNYYCAPNKLFEFLACGKPVITNSFPGLIEVVEKNKWGICLDKINEYSISNAIKNMNTQEYEIKSRYFWHTIEERFLKLYKI